MTIYSDHYNAADHNSYVIIKVLSLSLSLYVHMCTCVHTHSLSVHKVMVGFQALLFCNS